MNDNFSPDPADRSEEVEEGDSCNGSGYRDPLDMNDEEWRDEQYGEIMDARRIIVEGGLRIRDDQALVALEALMAKTVVLRQCGVRLCHRPR